MKALLIDFDLVQGAREGFDWGLKILDQCTLRKRRQGAAATQLAAAL